MGEGIREKESNKYWTRKIEKKDLLNLSTRMMSDNCYLFYLTYKTHITIT